MYNCVSGHPRKIERKNSKGSENKKRKNIGNEEKGEGRKNKKLGAVVGVVEMGTTAKLINNCRATVAFYSMFSQNNERNSFKWELLYWSFNATKICIMKL